MGCSVQPAAFRSEVRHPDLRRIHCLRRPDQPFAVWRESRPLFVVRRLIQPARFSARRRHNPKMRLLRVCREVHINRGEYDPLPIGRGHRFTHALEGHHVLEGERSLGACRRRVWRRLRAQRNGESERSDQSFPSHGVVSVRIRKLPPNPPARNRPSCAVPHHLCGSG